MANPDNEIPGLEAINKLKSTDPPLFLSPNPDLSLSSRIACQYLFTLLKPYSPKSPFDQLYTDGFDAEQIWQQIDLQSLPIISSVKREIKRFEKNPDEISNLFGKKEVKSGVLRDVKENGEVPMEEDSEEFDGLSDDDEEDEELERKDDCDDVDDDDDDGGGGGDDDDDDGDEEEEEEEDDGDGVPEVEDDFLKIRELEKYLEREEEREYGSEEKKSKKKKKKGANDVKALRKDLNEDEVEDEAEDEEDENEGGEEDDELLMFGEGDEDEDEDELGDDIRYEDFFVPDKKTPKRKRKQADESDDSGMEDGIGKQEENLSTFEKERLKIQAKIKEMEEENLKPKDWTMQGEVVASKRPKDSALEVDLDFEHNARPPPVITEEVTASLEEIIKQRITEGNFDDVQKAPKLPSGAPKERKELDDSKSKKGLAEVYEEEYAQQTGLASTPISFNDELKKEASSLFKRLCFKLDALSHFHFAPKPVVEDMSIQANVPALAMEEIAPVAVSDAAMLAPEEVFAGKGDIKEETELTKEDRKRRRAKKKRKIKAKNAKSNSVSRNQSQAQSAGKQ